MAGSKVKSTYRGVIWNRAARKWIARIDVNYEFKYLGAFDDQLDAAKAYDIAARMYKGPKAKVNFGGGK